MATLHLADMGADVVKIETRRRGLFPLDGPGARRNVDSFRLLNRNKRACGST